MVNDLFEEQTDLEKIVKKIMHRAQTLLKCERCSVLLLEDIESPVSHLLSVICVNEIKFSFIIIKKSVKSWLELLFCDSSSHKVTFSKIKVFLPEDMYNLCIWLSRGLRQKGEGKCSRVILSGSRWATHYHTCICNKSCTVLSTSEPIYLEIDAIDSIVVLL